VRHRDGQYLNNRPEQDHRGVKGRYGPIREFKCPRSAGELCRAYDELRNFLRSRSRTNQQVSADYRRFHFLRRTATVLSVLEAARKISSFIEPAILAGTSADRTGEPARGKPQVYLPADGQDYLTRAEIEAVIAAPDLSTWHGRCDRALLVLALQTGLRVSELITLSRSDVVLGAGAHVRCMGKGRKERATPIRKDSLKVLRDWLAERGGAEKDPLFTSIRGDRFSRDAVERIVRKHVEAAASQCPSLKKKRVTPHVLRHCVCFLTMSGTSHSRWVFSTNTPGSRRHSLGHFHQAWRVTGRPWMTRQSPKPHCCVVPWIAVVLRTGCGATSATRKVDQTISGGRSRPHALNAVVYG
jgi:integrase